MVGLIVNDGLAAAVTPVILAGIVSLIAYLFRQISRATEAQARSDIAMATVTANFNALDARVTHIERRFDASDLRRRKEDK